MTKTKLVCSVFSACLLLLAQSVGPALGQQGLKEVNELNQRAINLYQAGNYAEAISLARRALELQEQALGPTHPRVAYSLNGLGGWMYAAGDSVGARLLYERSLKILEQALGPTHPTVAGFLAPLAMLLMDMGDYAGARSLFERALKIQEQTSGPTHPTVGYSLNALAGLLQATGDYAGARLLYERALKIQEQTSGPTHLAEWTTLNALAGLLQKMGDYAGARPLYERALKIVEQASVPTGIMVALSLNNLAGLLTDMGDYAGARPLCERALKIEEQALVPVDPSIVAKSLNNLAVLEVVEGRFGFAAGLYKRGSLFQDRFIQNVFKTLTEAKKLTFIEFLSDDYSAYLSLLHQHLNADTDALRDGLELVLRRKGVVFDVQSRVREALKGRLSETARKDFDQLSALRSELAHFSRKTPDTMGADLYNDKMNALQQEIEATERRLANESALVEKELQQRTITIEQVAKQLPKHGALAEFVKIRDRDFAKMEWKSSWRYLAFILTAAGNVTLVDLGEADALERQADRTLEDIKVALTTRRKDHLLKSQESLAQLSALVWTPLVSALGQADTLIVSPDSQLNLVPFAALVERTGQPLVERYHLTYVGSGRELLTTGAAFTPETELLLVANPAYDQTAPEASGPGTTLRSRDFRGHFDPLPGTEREAHEIPPLVSGPPAQKRVVVGPSATERVVTAAHSPRILHLATHGFFLQDKLVSRETSLRGVKIEMGSPLAARPRDQLRPQRYENPLLQSGLAFAGANHAGESTGGEDGILTALEITGTDLNGTELVVLSACETALGTIRTGEGVFGLRRAFALAGAKNLLMSLWSVDDEVTADQMKAFYQNLQTLSPADALRQAQRETIRRLKERDGIANPGLWAPFILQGATAFNSLHSVAKSQ